MTPTGKESPELTNVQTAIALLLSPIFWERPREKTPDPIQCAPRTIVYPSEIADVVETA
jgi:hypothetical protein